MKRTPWTTEQLQKLRELYPDNRAEDLVEALGHAKSSIYSKARKLNLSKSDAFKASEQVVVLCERKELPISTFPKMI